MKNILIIGNSAAGVAAVEGIRARDAESKITVVSHEPYPAYCRCLIPDYLAGRINEVSLSYRDRQFYQDNKVELLTGKKVERVDVKKKRAVLEDKAQVAFDVLLIASGASPKMPEGLKGVNKRGVFGFRTIDDARKIAAMLPISHTSCVLGGGLVGLKAACALKKRGQDVKVLVHSGNILSQISDPAAAELFQRRFRENGIEILLNTGAREIIGNGDVKAVKLDSGKVLGCSLVVVGKGVSPNIRLLRDSGIETDKAVLVDSNMRASIDGVYAAGDVAQAYDIVEDAPRVNALWPCAVEQGLCAGENIAGAGREYRGSLAMNSVGFFGLSLVSMGRFNPRGDGDEAVSFINKEKATYKKLVFCGDRLVGGLFVGNIAGSGLYLRLIREKADISRIKDDLLDENISYARIRGLVEDKEKVYL